MKEAAQRPTSFLRFLVRLEANMGRGREPPRGKVGNLLVVFHFSIRGEARLWECGNLAVLARFPRGGGKGGKAALAFPCFPRAVISIALSRAPVQVRGGDGASILQRRSSCARAAAIFRAHSVSLIFCAVFSNCAKLTFALSIFLIT